MNRVIERRMIVPNLHLLTLEAPDTARKVKPGQFVIVRSHDEGERIPLSVADWDVESGTVSTVFMEVGASTGRLALLAPGDVVPTCVGPLGNPTEIANFGTVLCIGGCYGIGSIYPVCRALKKAGNRVLDRYRGEKLLPYLLAEGACRCLVQYNVRDKGRKPGGEGTRRQDHRLRQGAAEDPRQDNRERVHLFDGPGVGGVEGPRDPNLRQSQSHYDRRHGHVRRMPRDGGRTYALCLRRRSRVQRP